MEPTTTPGPLALLGGGEHRQPCRPIDRWLMERVGHGAVRVVVIPAASARSGQPLTAALARNHWTALGARVQVVVPGHTDAGRAHDALAAADVVVLTGGVPGRLVSALGASAVWEHVLARWHAGAAISGSSAGAMALWAWRLALRPPSPVRTVPGLGPLDGAVCIPHWDRIVRPRRLLRRWVRAVQPTLGGLGVVGIDEATALVVDGGRWAVHGQGSVTLVDRLGTRAVASGAAVDTSTAPWLVCPSDALAA